VVSTRFVELLVFCMRPHRRDEDEILCLNVWFTAERAVMI
jgi:hypothetical protein